MRTATGGRGQSTIELKGENSSVRRFPLNTQPRNMKNKKKHIIYSRTQANCTTRIRKKVHTAHSNRFIRQNKNGCLFSTCSRATFAVRIMAKATLHMHCHPLVLHTKYVRTPIGIITLSVYCVYTTHVCFRNNLSVVYLNLKSYPLPRYTLCIIHPYIHWAFDFRFNSLDLYLSLCPISAKQHRRSINIKLYMCTEFPQNRPRFVLQRAFQGHVHVVRSSFLAFPVHFSHRRFLPLFLISSWVMNPPRPSFH